jgi:hypothetical protein
MQYAPPVLPAERLTCGIDWAREARSARHPTPIWAIAEPIAPQRGSILVCLNRPSYLFSERWDLDPTALTSKPC